MSKIILTRIDDRLVHGQIFMQWCGEVNADMILIANNDAAASHFKQGLMDMAVPADIETRYWSIKETIIRYHKMENDYRILLVVRSPEDLVELIKGGLDVQKVNIGNLQMAEGKIQKTTSVSVNEDDIKAFRQLKDMGCQMEIKRLPQSEPEDFNAVIS